MATVALNGAKNAGILAAQIVGATDDKIAKTSILIRNLWRKKVIESAQQLETRGWKSKKIGLRTKP